MSPRTKQQFDAMREEKRALIMEAALEHFAKEGYHQTTINHLAKHAGISKGLMYNYFSSKEELLVAILNKSMTEVSAYFDPDKDGILTADEFELFVRRYFAVIREKVVFWRLLFQIVLQKEVRDQLMVSSSDSPDDGQNPINQISDVRKEVAKIILDYFIRKNQSKPDSDPLLDMNMFIYTIQGFALMIIYNDSMDDEHFEKTINKIIETYK